VSLARALPYPGSARGPRVWLLDASHSGADADALRQWAREQTARSGLSYVSRSYSHPLALAAWHRAAVGVDVERVTRCDAELADVICTPAEREVVVGVPCRDRLLSALWSSKEALSKALGDALDYNPARLDAPMRWPQHRSGNWTCAPLPVPATHVGWVCWFAIVGDDGGAVGGRDTSP
jgi:phosphopantetheinyl transferase